MDRANVDLVLHDNKQARRTDLMEFGTLQRRARFLYHIYKTDARFPLLGPRGIQLTVPKTKLHSTAFGLGVLA